MKLFMLINVEMPTFGSNVVILAFISMIIITYESLKARKVSINQHLSSYEQLKLHA